MIELGLQGQKKAVVEQGREDPLVVAKDIGHILSIIFVPRALGNLLAALSDKGIIDDKKEYGIGFEGFDPERLKELVQTSFHHLFRVPNILAKESGETGQGSVKK
jgi:hypothetical protein